ncbi:MAG: polysaccharide deacetylase [Proteobacteria bacterium]|nr:polysaccharide deacetylase [Pseudomonadota bacterium]
MRASIRRWSRLLATGSDPFDALARELARWRAAPARFWWRDDDAVAPSAALDRLLALRERLRIPLALAVIPAEADPALAARIAPEEAVRVLVHGWTHRNHAQPGAPPSEYPASRDAASVQAELAGAAARLGTLFGSRALKVLVPPFNALAPALAPAAAAAGLRVVSVDRDFADIPMPAHNIHADVIDWDRHTAVPEAEAVRPLLAALRLRRYGLVPRSEPVGVMTHHLAHDEAVWSLAERLLDLLARHEGAAFPAVEAIFPESARAP